MEIKQKLFIILKGQMYLIDSKQSSVFKMATKGKPKLFVKKSEAVKRSDMIEGSYVKEVTLGIKEVK